MGILVNTGFDLGSGSPLDNRTLKDTTNERDALVTEGKVHENLKVYCKDTQKEYRWTGTEWETVGSSGSGGDLDLTDYQKKTDNTLDTTDKTVTGAINELVTRIDEIKITDIIDDNKATETNVLSAKYVLNNFEPRKEVISKIKLPYDTNYIRAYCDYSATIPATVRVTDDDGNVLLITGSDIGSWRAVRLIKGETDRFKKVYYKDGYVYIQVDKDSMYAIFGGSSVKVFGSPEGSEIPIEDMAADTHTHDNKDVLDLLTENDEGKLQYNGVTIGGTGSSYDDTEVVKKTDITTTIDRTSVDTQVPSAKIIYDEFIVDKIKDYYVNINSSTALSKYGIDDITTLTSLLSLTSKLETNIRFTMQINDSFKQTLYDCGVIPANVGGLLVITQQSRGKAVYTTDFCETYVNVTSNAKNTEWGKWQKVYTTSVANVDTTIHTPDDRAIAGTIEYTVKNSICYVSLINIKSTKDIVGSSICTTMPKPAINSRSPIFSQLGGANTGLVYINKNTTQLIINIYKADEMGDCIFSYPVAER